MAKTPRRYIEQASNLSLIRYGPEISALTALLRDAQSTRDTRLRQAVNARDAGVSSALSAIPAVHRAYQGAAKQVTPAFVNGGGIEAQALKARMGESEALASSQLQDRRVAAVQGAGAARGQALREYAQDKGKIQQRAVDLSREQGAFTSSTIMDLLGADAKATADAAALGARLTQQERNSIRASGIDPNTGAVIPNGPLDPNSPRYRDKNKPNGKKWASSTQQTAAADTLGTATHEAKTLKASGASRSEVASMLLEGVDDVRGKPVYRTVTKNGKQVQERVLNPDGTQKTTGGIPGVQKISHPLLVSAALDIAFDGHLSKRTQRLLHARGIKIGPLGVRTYGDFLRALQRASAPGSRGNRGRVTPLAPGANGQQRPT